MTTKMRMNRPVCGCLCALALAYVSLLNGAMAQDNHYWTIKYGTRAPYMGAAVVGGGGGVRDLSSVYYNPGGLAFVDSPNVSASGSALVINSLGIDDGYGKGLDIQSVDVSAVPAFAGGSMKFESLPNHTFGYSVLARQEFHFEATTRRSAGAGSVFQSSDQSDLNEVWLGASWAVRPVEWLGFGATPFLAIRSHSQQDQYFEGDPDTAVATEHAFTSTSYTSFRGVIKLGMTVEFSKVKAGLAITTPSVHINGSGTRTSDADFKDDKGVSRVGNDRQDHLEARFRSPASLALGFEFEVAERTTVAISTEWFGGLSKHHILRSQRVDDVDGDNAIHDAEAIVNWGLGVAQEVGGSTVLMLGFHSNYTSESSKEDNAVLAYTDWNLYHVTVGVAYHATERSEVTFGIDYGTSWSDHTAQIDDISDIESESDRVDVDHTVISLNLGANIRF